MQILDKLFILLQRLIPQHWLSCQMFKLTRCEIPAIKNFLIQRVIRFYHVEMKLAAEEDPKMYKHFNDFFTRELKPDARPFVREKNTIACPIDGAVSQAGTITNALLFQAKGHQYSLNALLANKQKLSPLFYDGTFSTLYLSPKDYHRIHMPIDGTLKEMVYVPGDLFAVNQRTVRQVSGLFARNERTIVIFDTAIGPMAMILVGAIFVGSMETVWHEGTITPAYGKDIAHWEYSEGKTFKKGEEMGRFNMGSTVILLFGKDAMSWTENLHPGAALKMGQKIGQY